MLAASLRLSPALRRVGPSTVRGLPRPGRVAALNLRKLSEEAASSTSLSNEEPPLPVRGLLVGSTTALMTPLFPVIGFNQLVFRYATPEMKMALHGGTSMIYFSAMTLMPNAFYYAPVLLPFAIGNGVTAGVLYLAVDRLAGGPKALSQLSLPFQVSFANLSIPLAGPLLGLTTAFAAPFTYPYCFNLVHSINVFEGSDQWQAMEIIYQVCMNWWLGPCLAVTGASAGLLIHVFLQPAILGVPGWPWPRLAGGVLAATALAVAALYSSSTRTNFPHLRDADLDNPSLKGWFADSQVSCIVEGEDFCWVPRLEAPSGAVVSQQLRPSDLSACEIDFEISGDPEPGLRRTVEAGKLRQRAQRSTARCFESSRDAYWDGIMEGMGRAPLQAEDLRRLEASLPLLEYVMADALILFLLGSVKKAALESRLEELQPVLRTAKPKVTASALAEELLGLRAAQFREWLRLHRGAKEGPFSEAHIRQRLEEAGLKPMHVRQRLEQRAWKFVDTDALRQADWDLITNHKRQEAYAAAAKRIALGGIAVASLAGAYACYAQLVRE